MLYLYDPINNTKKEIDYKLLSGITGKSIKNLMSYKSKNKKISNINSYLIDSNTSKEQLCRFMQNEKIKNEIWKQINNSLNYYISNYGRVKRIYKNGKHKILMPYIKHNKWLFVKVNINGSIKETAIHKLVAKHFIENPNKYSCVRHKNQNILDNYAHNLEYIDRKTLGEKTAYMSKAIPVFKIDTTTNEIIDEYESMAQAGRCNFLHRETIRQCIKGKLKTAGGFKWTIDTGILNNKEAI
ncbi:hypothetical protein RSJ22_00560 (plasmid) [Clostridium botulinum]|uniref:NUMOD4 domain-containing protein n=1 Tax=Clostridium botulinum TaxID=1491 RepID=UPI000C7916AA|nr:NUMOD4 domain-containing protein [Clostridium botulinum]AUN20019.1 hypothetical protein RSJ22_00560 [Clostridium botulinum]